MNGLHPEHEGWAYLLSKFPRNNGSYGLLCYPKDYLDNVADTWPQSAVVLDSVMTYLAKASDI